MPEEDRDRGLSSENRLWRIEERLQSIMAAQQRFEQLMVSLERRADRTQYIADVVDGLARRDVSKGTSPFSDPAVIKMIFYGLLALVIALATGQFINFTGLLK